MNEKEFHIRANIASHKDFEARYALRTTINRLKEQLKTLYNVEYVDENTYAPICKHFYRLLVNLYKHYENINLYVEYPNASKTFLTITVYNDDGYGGGTERMTLWFDSHLVEFEGEM